MSKTDVIYHSYLESVTDKEQYQSVLLIMTYFLLSLSNGYIQPKAFCYTNAFNSSLLQKAVIQAIHVVFKCLLLLGILPTEYYNKYYDTYLFINRNTNNTNRIFR